MPIFAYQALTLSGQSCRGREVAETIDHLRDVLATRDLILKSARMAQAQGMSRGVRIPLKHLAAFNRQFVVLLQAGVTIPQSLSILMARPGQPRLEAALRQLLEDVTRGLALSQAAEKQAAAFDGPYRAVIATGERAGALAQSLQRYQGYMDLRLRIGAQVSKAMVYPIVLLLTLAGVLAFLFLAVIPNFVAMYADLGSDLPWPTMAVVIVYKESSGACEKTGIGAFHHLATIDSRQYVRPFGALSRDELSRLTVQLAQGSVERKFLGSSDIAILLSRVRFECGGGDEVTPSWQLTFFDEARVVYSTGLVSKGLQTEEFGYIVPSRPYRELFNAIMDAYIPELTKPL